MASLIQNINSPHLFDIATAGLDTANPLLFNPEPFTKIYIGIA